jgi:tetratricopeptide (TPR) repeat protein
VIQLRRLPEFVPLLACALNAILLVELLLIATADPSWQLMAAVLCECGFFLAINAYRVWQSKSNSSRAEVAALDRIEKRFRIVYCTRRSLALAAVAGLTVACLYMSADLFGLTLCRCGRVADGERLYRAINFPVPGIHPAFSMELLTGALIERGQFESAQPLELALLRIRRSLFGEQNELTAAMYSNLGDFYSKWGRSHEAEIFYRRAIKLTQILNLKQGWGSPATKLGTLLRKEGRLVEAEECFSDALKIRTERFGANSLKVAETLSAYKELLIQENRALEATNVGLRVDAISASLLRPHAVSDDWLFGGLFLVIASLFAWQRGKLLIYFSKILDAHIHPRAEIRKLP